MVTLINQALAQDKDYSDWLDELNTLDTEYHYYECLAGQRLSRYQDLYDTHAAQIQAGGGL